MLSLNLSHCLVLMWLLSGLDHIIKTILMSKNSRHTRQPRESLAPWLSARNIPSERQVQKEKGSVLYSALNLQLMHYCSCPEQRREDFSNISIKMLWEHHSSLSYPNIANVQCMTHCRVAVSNGDDRHVLLYYQHVSVKKYNDIHVWNMSWRDGFKIECRIKTCRVTTCM